MAFTKIRGPIGAEREDTYASMISYYSQPPREKSLTYDDFLWWSEEPPADPDDEEKFTDDVDDKYQE